MSSVYKKKRINIFMLKPNFSKPCEQNGSTLYITSRYHINEIKYILRVDECTQVYIIL